jgi:hypothetical protein
MRLLLISFAFPPVTNAQAIRWLMLVRQLAARHIEVHVLSIALPPPFRDLLDEVPADVAVHRVWPGPFEGTALRTRARMRLDDDWIASRRRGGGLGLLGRGYRGARKAANAILIPDLHTEWLPFALPEAMSLVRRIAFDAVVSTHEPGVNHLVAWRVKRRTALPWVADFADPWINQNTPAWRRAVDERIERRFWADIDAVTVSTPELEAFYRHEQRRPSDIWVVPQGFDEAIIAAVATERPPGARALHVVYTGTLYPRLREPSAVFAGIALARQRGLDVGLTIAGRIPIDLTNVVARLGLGEVIRFAGIVPYKRSVALQKGADLLLQIDNRDAPLQTAGKLFEYFGAGRPILVVRHGDATMSSAARCVREGGCGRDVPDDPQAIADALVAFDREQRAGASCSTSADFAAAHTFRRSADQLCAAIAHAVERPARALPEAHRVRGRRA